MSDLDAVDLDFTGDLWRWRGPSPFYFVTVPDDGSHQLHAVAAAVTSGWGMIPTLAQVGATEWRTSLFPKDGLYVLPVKDAVRRAEELEEGATVTVRVTVGGPRAR